MRFMVLIFLVLFCAAVPARAETVRALRAGWTLMLDTGRSVRLQAVRAADPRRALRQAGVGSGFEVSVDWSAAGKDRYGQTVAPVRLDGGMLLSHRLIETGQARVTAPVLTGQVDIDVLLALEAKARQAGRGAWGTGALRVFQATPYDGPHYEDAVVTGRVRAVTAKYKYTYLNFGADWRRDFTVAIRKQDRAAFEARRGPLEALSGRKVRVRGWVQRRNGPFLELHDPAFLETVPGQQ